MMKKFIRPSVGQRFGRWTVLSAAGKDKNGKHLFLCMCECGTESNVYGSSLKSGHSRSCGCLKLETCVKSMLSGRGLSSPTLNYKKPEYRIWCAMKDRCNRQKNKNYADYGGRGIRVCNEWNDSFEAFYSSVGQRPTSLHSIDRIDNDGDYEPGNVRWATQSDQARNTRTTRKYTYKGETLSLTTWAERVGIKPCSLKYRLNMGWQFERAITEPVRVSRAS